jgi:sirohydrochlorin ferrochelatase
VALRREKPQAAQTDDMTKRTALLLIAHGSRNAEANDDLHALASALGERGGYQHVVASFLELAEPNIPDGGRQCVALGAERVVLVPYFLSAGVHVRDDLQRFRAELAASHPGVEFVVAEPLGRHPALVDIVLQRVRESVSNPKHSALSL